MFVKLFKILFLPILFIIFSCDDAGNIISNPPGEINELYQFNLTFLQVTENRDTITVFWDKNEAISTFNIEIMDLGINEPSNNPDNFTFPLLPGLFTDVIISADDVLTDTIKVFSAPMAPSTWEPDFLGDIKIPYYPGELGDPPYNQIEIIKSTETDISEVILYKMSNNGNSLAIYGTPLDYDSWTMLSSFNIYNNNIFIEELISNEYYCYITNTIDENGNSRYSIINCNNTNDNDTIDSITLSSVSMDLENKINIEWTKYNNENFYQYILYRSENEEVDDSSRIPLAIIIDANQTIFEDRNNIGIGKTLYYQIEVHNQFGRIKKSSIISGKSKP